MKRKPNIIIHMGANTFTVDVRANKEFVRFDMNKLDTKAQNKFRKELTFQFREALEAA